MTHLNGRTAGSRLRLVTVVAAVGLAGLAGCSSGGPPASTGPEPSAAPSAALAVPYQSPDGYRISPPAGWVLHSATGVPGLSVVFGAPEADTAGQKPFADNLNVLITPTSDTLDNLVAQTKQQGPTALTNYQVVLDEPTTTANGQPAHLLGATYDREGVGPLRNIQLLTVSGGKEYTATITATAGNFDRLQDVGRASVTSLSVG